MPLFASLHHCMTAKLFLPSHDRCQINPRRNKEQSVTKLHLFFSRRKGPGAHLIKDGGDKLFIGHPPYRKTQVRHLSPGFNRQIYVQTAHETRVHLAFAVIHFLKLGKEAKNLLL
jgi:hypothetical protein